MNIRPPTPPIHPGVYIKNFILPIELSVTNAAKRLGVGRPALSNLLNGNATLSPDMAVKIEKTFGANASELLDKQRQYDEFAARTQLNQFLVRPYVHAYHCITAQQIESWANKNNARYQFAALVRLLVLSTGTGLSLLDFPAFDNAERPGWDGKVIADYATPWIPSGTSGWELGCGKNPKKKANEDYRTRSNKISPKEQRFTTFVFVTPRNWPGKTAWLKSKKENGNWQDVRAYDASDLEQWLEQSLPGQIRMQEFLGIARLEIKTLEQVWQEWANVTEPNLPKEFFTSAVEQYDYSLKKWLSEKPVRALVVTAASPLEALAFLVIALERASEPNSSYFDRALVIRTQEALEKIRSVSSNLILIVESQQVERSLAGLQKEVHTIIVRGQNSITGRIDIALNQLSYQSFREALHVVGFDENEIIRYARESARVLTILRRRLASVEAIRIPDWSADSDLVRSMIPIVFAGAWDSNCNADRQILEQLSEFEYNEIERKFSQLQEMDDSPVWSVSQTCGVVAKIDALYAISPLLTKNDVNNFLNAVKAVSPEKNPLHDLPKGRYWGAGDHNIPRTYSNGLRQGLCDTLVLLAVHGQTAFGERLGIDINSEIESVVHMLLSQSVSSRWLSQNDNLQYYAEAAPDIFLQIVEDDLNSANPKIAILMDSSNTVNFGEQERARILWALEILAWKPERLPRVAFVLARLCEFKFNNNQSSTPMHSLKSIFRIWMPQTAASLKERNQVLETLTSKFPKVGWRICIGLFRLKSDVGIPNVKPRWRTDAQNAGEPIADQNEIYKARDHAIQLALNWPEHNEHTLSQLIECLENLSPKFKKQVWKVISNWINCGCTDIQKETLRESVRLSILTQFTHRQIVDAKTQKRARKVYESLEPQDIVLRHRWLFASHWIEPTIENFEEDRIHYQVREKRVAKLRREALNEIWFELGSKGINRLCKESPASDVVGYLMVEFVNSVQHATEFLQYMFEEQSGGSRNNYERCIVGFLRELDSKIRESLLLTLIEKYSTNDDTIIRLLQCSPFDSCTWKRVDQLPDHIKHRYWTEVQPQWGYYHDAIATAKFVMEMLDVDRSYVAFETVKYQLEVLNSTQLMQLLKELGASELDAFLHLNRLDERYVSEAMTILDKRGDISSSELAELEFMFIEVLEGSEYGIKNMEAQLAQSPEFFAQVISLGFERKHEGEYPPKQRNSKKSKKKQLLAISAHTLLATVKKIPGTREDGSIDEEKLVEWLKRARKLTHELNLPEIGDQQIGKLLSHCKSGDDEIWPCEPVRNAIEFLQSKNIALGMYIGHSNSQGAVLRQPGVESEERILARQLKQWSRDLAIEQPFVAKMLSEMAKTYEQKSKWWENYIRVQDRLET